MLHCYYLSVKIKCPISGKETLWEDNKFRPFCSERRKLVDLGAWVSENYEIPRNTIKKEKEKE
jgi:endogenous inhibitor of DNA gyrase (YacG/DUF329 family)